MTLNLFWRWLVGCVILLPWWAWANPGPVLGEQGDSPYFVVNSSDPATDRLPLKNTKVDVRVVGVIADVTVTQQYRNEGKSALEARYVFPGSTRAAVYGMTVRLGQRVLTAAIREKQQAQADYNQAKQQGKTAALLEQQRANVFEMNVANILPGDEVNVELHYTELLVPTDGVYQFVFPTVVGPRYNGQAATAGGAEKWAATAHLPAGEVSRTGFIMNVRLATPAEAKEIRSPSHSVEVQKSGPQEALVRLAPGKQNENNRDFILNYRLAGEQIESGILLSRGKKENFFLAMVEPPKQVANSQIVPREYVFVVDISGSMHGFPLDTTKVLMQKLLGNLRPADSFNVMLFSGSNTMLAPKSVPATPQAIERALTLLNEQMGSGGTELVPALRDALAMPADGERARTFVVVTDGFVTVEKEVFQLIRQNLNKANVFSFGIGTSVNRMLMEGIARAGQGEPYIVLDASSAAEQAERFRRVIDSPVLSHLKARFDGFEAYDVEPLTLPDVFAQRPVILFGKWRGEPKGRLVLEGRAATGPFKAELPIKAEQVSTANEALRYLWARHRVAALSDQQAIEGGDTYRQQILDLGLGYNLLTAYTSFIAIDERVRNPNGSSDTVNQPQPLPEGVGNQAIANPAIANQVSSTPEPATWAMLLMALAGMVYVARRQAKARS
ncbi:VIT domain-containing protein [Parachitinimonas caeni]|uniref:VIT domain-containing protein n=1 Tax=Parachitinimonas caeni TaxID=3031301 RepID=A0ABT7DVM5_9NEIS|nr:VIT domain-containing protein [Parachitinimonas caeni]MDK2124115.1 VIT domain-containing protein [Parachitinimonas caeni]